MGFDITTAQNILTNSVAAKYIMAVLVLVIGWVAAKFIASIFKKVLLKATFLGKFFEMADVKISPEKVINVLSLLLYYIILFVVLIAFLDLLGLESIKSTLESLQGKYLPGLLSGATALVIAWIIATLAKLAITKGFNATHLDEKISKEVSANGDSDSISISATLANAAYWFIFLYFLPSILKPLGFEELLNPIYDLNSTIVGYLPKILAAGVIFIIGLFVAKILRKIVSNLLSAVGADKIGEKIGLKGKGVSSIAGTVVYIVILLPVIVQALDALEVEAISKPATDMISTILNSLPSLLFAVVILGISLIVGRLLSGLVTELLTNLGFNDILKTLGLKVQTKTQASKIAGGLVLTFIMLFASIEAANQIGFSMFGEILKEIMSFAGNILVGVAVFGLGAYIANIVSDLVKATSKSKVLPTIAKTAVLVLAIAMGLRQMGIADDIINLAFGLTLGSIAVAGALAFGLGSKEIAAKQLEKWLKNSK